MQSEMFSHLNRDQLTRLYLDFVEYRDSLSYLDGHPCVYTFYQESKDFYDNYKKEE